MTYLEAAYQILRRAGTPLHNDVITARALDEGLISPTGRTLAATMGSRLYTDTKLPGSKFVRAGRGVFALAETRPGDITDQVTLINQTTRERLRRLVQAMPPDRFEALITELLLQMGFDERTVTVTPYNNDGGIDVVGIYRAAGLTEVNAAVQVKRWRGNVRAPTVTQLRGSLQVHQQGIIITTSDFSDGARKEAAAPGKTRIGLISGEELLDLLIRHRVGVVEKTLIVTTVDDDWWGELIVPPIISPPPPPPSPIPKFTGRKPNVVTLLGERMEVRSWATLLTAVCDRLARHAGPEFVTKATGIRGKKRAYISQEPVQLFKPARIPSVDLWVETNLSAKDIHKLVMNLLKAAGVPDDQLQIELAPEPLAES